MCVCVCLCVCVCGGGGGTVISESRVRHSRPPQRCLSVAAGFCHSLLCQPGSHHRQAEEEGDGDEEGGGVVRPYATDSWMPLRSSSRVSVECDRDRGTAGGDGAPEGNGHR